MSQTPDLEFPIVEHFYTLQGEGSHAGLPAYFVRLGGCDIGCPWCDTKKSWKAERHPRASIAQIVGWAAEAGALHVVVTGGEPAQYELTALTRAFREAGMATHLETSGAYPITGTWDWVCVSPKTYRGPLPDSLAKADELKVVVEDADSLRWAEQNALGVRPGCRLYLQPEWNQRHTQLAAAIDHAKRFPRWRVSIQSHKFIDIP